MNRVEKWLYTENILQLLQSYDLQRIEKAICFVEDVIDNIDDHNEDASVLKDIVTVSEAQYNESFPSSASVIDKNATLPVFVMNPRFHQIPLLLKKQQSTKKPIVVTSVRNSAASGKLQFGKQYIVDGFNDDGVRIHYDHEGNGETPISKEITEQLFTLQGMLTNRKLELEQETAKVCLR